MFFLNISVVRKTSKIKRSSICIGNISNQYDKLVNTFNFLNIYIK